jgi:hypothetical protein
MFRRFYGSLYRLHMVFYWNDFERLEINSVKEYPCTYILFENIVYSYDVILIYLTYFNIF